MSLPRCCRNFRWLRFSGNSTALKINTVELATGNYPGDAHCKLSMLEDAAALAEFQKVLADHGVTISALSCHGNRAASRQGACAARPRSEPQDHPARRKARRSVVVDFSGCPGDSPHATAPNWVTCPWPPDYLKVLDWQWSEVVTPYWIEHAKFAADHGVKIAIEMHPGFVVYSPETMLKLRSIAGPNVGCNFDPSHLFWQSIDPIAAVRLLEGAIFHVHAKDTQLYAANLPRTGVLDTKPYTAGARSQLDIPHLRLRPRRRMVERVDIDAAHVRLRLRSLHRARRQPALARRGPDQGCGFSQQHRHS